MAASHSDRRLEGAPIDAAGVRERANLGFPFPVLDTLALGVEGRGRKYVTVAETYFEGHFPGEPIVPGVLILAAFAAVAGAMADGGDGPPPLRRVARLRFHRPVRPGDVLDVVVRPGAAATDGRWYDATATVDGEAVARGRLLL